MRRQFNILVFLGLLQAEEEAVVSLRGVLLDEEPEPPGLTLYCPVLPTVLTNVDRTVLILTMTHR